MRPLNGFLALSHCGREIGVDSPIQPGACFLPKMLYAFGKDGLCQLTTARPHCASSTRGGPGLRP